MLTTTVDNVEHIESTTVTGQAVVKIFLQPGASLDTANAQITAVSQFILRQLPPGTLPPLIINYSASSVPISSSACRARAFPNSSSTISASTSSAHSAGDRARRGHSYPYGGKQRQMMINLVPELMQAKGVSPDRRADRRRRNQNLRPALRHGEDRRVRIRHRRQQQPAARWKSSTTCRSSR